jgi:hypothetical protein
MDKEIEKFIEKFRVWLEDNGDLEQTPSDCFCQNLNMINRSE